MTFTPAQSSRPQRSIFKDHRPLVFHLHVSDWNVVDEAESQNKATFEQVVLKSEKEYTKWLREVRMSGDPLGCSIFTYDHVKVVPTPSEGNPSTILVIHPRIPSGDANGPANPRSTSLRQSKDTFLEAAARLFQHRSIAYVMRRRSTAVCTSRQVNWTEGSDGPSIGKSSNCSLLSIKQLDSPQTSPSQPVTLTWKIVSV